MGWMQLERYIQVKKLLLVRSILIVDDQTLSKDKFSEGAGLFSAMMRVMSLIRT